MPFTCICCQFASETLVSLFYSSTGPSCTKHVWPDFGILRSGIYVTACNRVRKMYYVVHKKGNGIVSFYYVSLDMGNAQMLWYVICNSQQHLRQQVIHKNVRYYT